MTATIIRKEIRPSIEHLFFHELRDKRLFRESSDYIPELGEISDSWAEKIPLEEVLMRKKELRPDIYLDFFSSIGRFNTFFMPDVTFNPFSLTDTRIKVFDTESNLRNTPWLTYALSRDRESIFDIRRIENTIIYQIFVDEKLIETIEFK